MSSTHLSNGRSGEKREKRSVCVLFAHSLSFRSSFSLSRKSDLKQAISFVEEMLKVSGRWNLLSKHSIISVSHFRNKQAKVPPDETTHTLRLGLDLSVEALPTTSDLRTLWKVCVTTSAILRCLPAGFSHFTGDTVQDRELTKSHTARISIVITVQELA